MKFETGIGKFLECEEGLPFSADGCNTCRFDMKRLRIAIGSAFTVNRSA